MHCIYCAMNIAPFSLNEVGFLKVETHGNLPILRHSYVFVGALK